MSRAHLEFGRRGEQTAIDFLKNNGYNIIIIDYRNKLGQIDIIAKEKKTICFIEVKSRRGKGIGQPYESVTASKQAKIQQVALRFLRDNKLLDSPARFDIDSICYLYNGPQINLIKGAFDLDCRYVY